ncbi:MAG TPA: AraC family transcriptional regulator [Pseudolabrys sp.]|nr:AraC family transcriptional regulator [Pseudolabrys sp.]
MTDPAAATFRFSTDSYAPADRTEAWRAVFGHAICDLDIEPLPDTDFKAHAVVRALPGLGVAAGFSSGAHYWRPKHRIRNDDLIFVLNHDGTDRARMLDRESIIAPGQAVMFAADHVGGTTNKGPSRFTTIRVARDAIAPVLVDPGEAILRPVAPHNPALDLLKNYISVIENDEAMASARTQELIAAHIRDLIALALGATGDAAKLLGRRGVRGARLHLIKADIARRAIDLDLNIGRIAKRHGVSPRYIQMLFGSEGTSFSEYVLMQRLAAAHRMLTDAGTGHARIGEIGLSAGFNNVSYFNRAFRKQFGMAPSDVRARASDDQ